MKEYEIIIKVSYDQFGERSLSFVSPADAEEGDNKRHHQYA